MPGDLIWMPDRKTEAVVEEEVAPCSYNVSSSGGTLRRNHRNLVRLQVDLTETDRDTNNEEPNGETNEEPPVRRSTRVSRPLERLDPSWS